MTKAVKDNSPQQRGSMVAGTGRLFTSKVYPVMYFLQHDGSTSLNSTSNWRPSAQRPEVMGDVPYSDHHTRLVDLAAECLFYDARTLILSPSSQPFAEEEPSVTCV